MNKTRIISEATKLESITENERSAAGLLDLLGQRVHADGQIGVAIVERRIVEPGRV